MKLKYAPGVIVSLVLVMLAACVSAPPLQPAETISPAGESPSSPSAHPTLETGPPSETPAATETRLPSETQAATEGAAQQNPTVSFAGDILPVIRSRCINCHGGDRTEEGLVMLTHADLMAGSDNGPVVIPGNAARSLFVELVANQEMPKRGPKLTPPQIQLFTDWVNQGALDN